jgi:hypothetical protein
MKPKVPLWRWLTWWALLAPALVIFYVVFLPVWFAIRVARLFAHARAGN